jgi:hypothetical protein
MASKVILELDYEDINRVAEDYLGKKLSDTQCKRVLEQLCDEVELPREDIETAIDWIVMENCMD